MIGTTTSDICSWQHDRLNTKKGDLVKVIGKQNGKLLAENIGFGKMGLINEDGIILKNNSFEELPIIKYEKKKKGKSDPDAEIMDDFLHMHFDISFTGFGVPLLIKMFLYRKSDQKVISLPQSRIFSKNEETFQVSFVHSYPLLNQGDLYLIFSISLGIIWKYPTFPFTHVVLCFYHTASI